MHSPAGSAALASRCPHMCTQRQCRPTRHEKPSHSNLSCLLLKSHLLRHGQPPQAPHRPLCMSMLPLGHRFSQFSCIPSVGLRRCGPSTAPLGCSRVTRHCDCAERGRPARAEGVGWRTGLGKYRLARGHAVVAAALRQWRVGLGLGRSLRFHASGCRSNRPSVLGCMMPCAL